MTVILFFNKPSMTRRCVGSVARSATESEEFSSARSILLVDNGSREECAREVLEGYESRARVIRLENNAGFASGMNAGLRAAFADPGIGWATLVSNDVELDSTFCVEAARLISARATQAVIFCPSVNHLIDRSKPAYTRGEVLLPAWELRHGLGGGAIEFPAYYPAAVTVWTRAAFERLGGFNEKYFCYWEDVELSWRCGQAGVTLEPAPTLRAFHLGRGTTGGKRRYSELYRAGRQLTMEITGQGVL
jgi:GT2 family glycosyltransferase